MAKKYSMVHINKAIYIGNYLEGGLTQNRRKHNINSPIGCMNRAKEFMCPEIKMKYRLKGTLQYIIYGKFAEYTVRKLYHGTTSKFLFACMLVPGLIIHIKWKRRYK